MNQPIPGFDLAYGILRDLVQAAISGDDKAMERVQERADLADPGNRFMHRWLACGLVTQIHTMMTAQGGGSALGLIMVPEEMAEPVTRAGQAAMKMFGAHGRGDGKGVQRAMDKMADGDPDPIEAMNTLIQLLIGVLVAVHKYDPRRN